MPHRNSAPEVPPTQDSIKAGIWHLRCLPRTGIWHLRCLPRVAVLLLLVVQLACGYRVASKNRMAPQLSTIAVLPFVNETSTFEVEQILTRSFIRALVERSSYRVITDPSQADGILEGVLSGVSVSPVTFSQGSFGSTFLVTLNSKVELREQATGEVLLSGSYLFREQYVINVDVRNFFSELNPALERIADDFAASVVTTVLESF